MLINLYRKEKERKPLHELQSMASKLKFNLTADDIGFIESKSKLQSRTKSWHLFRAGRITASIAYRVCNVKSFDSSPSLIRSVCYPSKTQIQKKAILWGCEHEKDAVAMYLQINTPKHANLQVCNVVEDIIFLTEL